MHIFRTLILAVILVVIYAVASAFGFV